MKVQVMFLDARVESRVLQALVYEGRIKAIKLYKKLTGCKLKVAKTAVDRLAMAVRPGPTGYVE